MSDERASGNTGGSAAVTTERAVKRVPVSVCPQTTAERMIRSKAVAGRTMATCSAKPLARSDRPVIDRLDTDLPWNTNCSTKSPRF